MLILLYEETTHNIAEYECICIKALKSSLKPNN